MLFFKIYKVGLDRQVNFLLTVSYIQGLCCAYEYPKTVPTLEISDLEALINQRLLRQKM